MTKSKLLVIAFLAVAALAIVWVLRANRLVVRREIDIAHSRDASTE